VVPCLTARVCVIPSQLSGRTALVVDPRLSGPLKLIITEGSKLLKVWSESFVCCVGVEPQPCMGWPPPPPCVSTPPACDMEVVVARKWCSTV